MYEAGVRCCGCADALHRADSPNISLCALCPAVYTAVQVAIKKAYVAADVSFASDVVEVDTESPRWVTVKVGSHHGSTIPAFSVRRLAVVHGV
jgi:hypothetical protein